ncbi:hypothetical protein [Chitinophaga japonensis]|uniref:DUF4412 domain-containing protein n=1 Tax=Chitinophaga japonensis TaxID=104662 RepID=A0A562TCK1_CHIJA|nr:hypothetical protein [Chitinophaga japonensis]TWI91008.1 hypothetical protein LX66_0369 [Chitinophaga japonensis]
MRKAILLLSTLLPIFSCAGSAGRGENTGSDSLTAQSTVEKAAFGEGKITVDIYFPDNPLSKVLNKIDPAKGNMQEQFATLSKTLTAEDAQQINRVMKGNPIQAMMVMFSPLLKNEIFVREGNATAKCDGLVYHLENQLEGNAGKGKIFLQSQADKGNQVTFSYDKDFLGQSQVQTVFERDKYDRAETGETAQVAGYNCTKAVYTLKPGGGPGVGKLEVWTSAQMPRSLNFIHPFYLDEDHGIMKIVLFLDGGSSMVYEFKKVLPGEVSAADMAIQESQPVYDAATAGTALSGKIMGVMFGTK